MFIKAKINNTANFTTIVARHVVDWTQQTNLPNVVKLSLVNGKEVAIIANPETFHEHLRGAINGDAISIDEKCKVSYLP